MDYSSLEVVDAGGPEAMEQAFRQGHGDFVHLQGPTAQQLEHEGKGAVRDLGPLLRDDVFLDRETGRHIWTSMSFGI